MHCLTVAVIVVIAVAISQRLTDVSFLEMARRRKSEEGIKDVYSEKEEEEDEEEEEEEEGHMKKDDWLDESKIVEWRKVSKEL